MARPRTAFFVETSDDVDAFLHDHAAELTYGWGVIPARVRIDDGDVVHILLSVELNRLPY